MTDRLYDTTQISRRKVLAGLGTIGIAAAGAGIGTSAFFSDREDFINNRLVAGSLDMKVDWEEHYSDWSDDETEFARMPVGDEEPDYILPARYGNVLIPDARPIELVFEGADDAAKQASKDALWDTTSIEAFPDADDDGIQDEFSDDEACDILADVGDEEDGGLDPTGDGSRTRNFDTYDEETGEIHPLINMNDVKPGDFGEVTLSFHLCDNPGYVWLTGGLIDEAENGVTEPEAEDPEEIDGVVELADYIMTRAWYDPNGNNQRDVVSGDLDIMMAIDTSGSISTDEMTALSDGVDAFVGALPTDGTVQVGSVNFGGNAVSNVVGLGAPGSYTNALPSSGSGNTPLPAAIDIADQYLDDNARTGAQKVVMVFTDGGPNYENTQYSAGGYTAPRGSPDETGFSDVDTNDQYDGAGGSGVVNASEQDETAAVAAAVRASGSRIVVVNVGDNPNANLGDGRDLSDYLEDEIASSGFYSEVAFDDLTVVADSLVASVLVPDEIFFQGSLRDFLAELADNDGRGIPLDGDLATPFEELTDPENDPDRDCFAGEGTTHYVAVQWWLPINHGNQVQTDSVTFDVGFYTEQCRHNDGAGMAPEDTPEDFVTVTSADD